MLQGMERYVTDSVVWKEISIFELKYDSLVEQVEWGEVDQNTMCWPIQLYLFL